jgi:3-methyladenine DNA glycosylase/8-oxoguanine DNA glycosylase
VPTFSLDAPTDFDLPRDCCSYGYFLLWPNFWDVSTRTFSRVLDAGDGPVGVVIAQKRAGGPLRVTTSRALGRTQKHEVVRQLTRMLRLDESAADIAAFHRVDPRWKEPGNGRLCRSPTFFEDVVKTITSCNIQWPGTMEMNRRLCQVVGEKLVLPPIRRGGAALELYSFPTAKKLARTRPSTLRARCRVGYRDVRLVEIAKRFATGKIDPAWFENPRTPDDDVHAALLDLPGVGPYAAANIMQLLGRYGRLPLDTESVRHGKAVLGMTGTSAQIMAQVREHFAPFGENAFRSYWFELRTFYESKHGPAHTWARESTGRLFTAALLAKPASRG